MDLWLKRIAALREKGETHKALKEIEKAREVLHEIGEVYAHRGWTHLKAEIEEIASLDTRSLALLESPQQAWDKIQRAAGARHVLELEAFYIETRDALYELYQELTRESRHGEEESASGSRRDADSTFPGFSFDETGS